MQRKKLYLIDGNAYCYRAYYAMGNLSTSYGQSTGAIYGFLTTFNKLKKEMRPDYLAVCFDLKGPTFRHEKFAGYKIQRKPMPDDLKPQIEKIKEIIAAYGVSFFERPGYEADDLIASLAIKFKEEADVFIVSPDKDMLQLAGKYIKIYNPQKGEAVIDENEVYRRYKVKPEQITDLLALCGDTADNIPGIPGIGEKTAAQLIEEFGSLEKIISNIGAIKQEKRKKLILDFSEQAHLSKELATVFTEVPLDMNLDSLKENAPDNEKLISIFRELEFKSLLKDLLNDASGCESAEKTSPDFKSVTNSKDLERLKEIFYRTKELSLIVRPDKDGRGICSIIIGKDTRDIFEIIPGIPGIPTKELAGFFHECLSRTKALKIGYDLKNAYVFLHKIGVELEGPFFDIMVAGYLLEPGTGVRGIDEISFAYLKKQLRYDEAVVSLFDLKRALERELLDKNLERLFSRIEMPLLEVLAAMQLDGVKVDKEKLAVIGRQLDEKLVGLTQKIYEISGVTFNINSPKQLSEILFDKLKLPILKRGKTGPSTDVEVLQRLAGQHPLPAVILEYRELAKLKTTYIEGLLGLIDPETSLIHTSFNQAITATGRLSSSSPNLQNIPVRTEAGRQIRSLFIAREKGRCLLSADYSQIELRVLAHLSKDENLIAAFKEDLDIHTFTASLIFGVDKKQVSEQMRDNAKRVNFGIIYGMGAFGLAKDLGISHDEAKRFIDGYFQRYPAVKKYLDTQITEAKEKGYVTTLLNRRRYIPQINSADVMQRNFAERIAMNTPIQGTAADLIKAAMVEIFKKFRELKLNSKMVLQVHDELIFDVCNEEKEQVEKIVKDKMEHVLELSVPIKITLKSGANWKEAK